MRLLIPLRFCANRQVRAEDFLTEQVLVSDQGASVRRLLGLLVDERVWTANVRSCSTRGRRLGDRRSSRGSLDAAVLRHCRAHRLRTRGSMGVRGSRLGPAPGSALQQLHTQSRSKLIDAISHSFLVLASCFSRQTTRPSRGVFLACLGDASGRCVLEQLPIVSLLERDDSTSQRITRSARAYRRQMRCHQRYFRDAVTKAKIATPANTIVCRIGFRYHADAGRPPPRLPMPARLR